MFIKKYLPLPLRKRFMDKRYAAFISSRFSEIKFDEDSWRAIVPESVAKLIAKPYHGKKILDPYAGIGGSAIQLALAGNHVTALEIDPKKFAFLRHNCCVYGVIDIDLKNISADDFKATGFDVVHLDPPWEGRNFDPKNYVINYVISAPEIIFKLPREMSNDRIFASRASRILEIFINDYLFVKVGYYLPGNPAAHTVDQVRIDYPFDFFT